MYFSWIYDVIIASIYLFEIMTEVFVANYYNLFDKKIENSTLIVLIICLCILFVWIITPASWTASYKSNVYESNQVKNTITIDGENYEIVLKKL